MAQNPALLDYFETAAESVNLRSPVLKIATGWVSRRCRFVSLHRPRGPWEASLFKDWPESWCTVLPVTSTPQPSQPWTKGRGDVLTLTPLQFRACHRFLTQPQMHWWNCPGNSFPPQRNRDNIPFLPLFVLSIYVINPFTCKRCCETAKQPEFVAMNKYL